jgi:hypothetical protein
VQLSAVFENAVESEKSDTVNAPVALLPLVSTNVCDAVAFGATFP